MENQNELFRYVYERDGGKCQVTWERIFNPSYTCFPHIVPKSRSPKNRLNPNNVILVKAEYHTHVDDLALNSMSIYEELLDNDICLTYDIVKNIWESEESLEEILSWYI